MPRTFALLALAGALAMAAACGGEDLAAPAGTETGAAPETDTAAELEPPSLDTLLTDARRSAYAPLEQRTLDREDLEEARDELREVTRMVAGAEVPPELEDAREAVVASLEEVADRYAGAARAAERSPDEGVDEPALRETTRIPLRSLETALDAFRSAGYGIPSS